MRDWAGKRYWLVGASEGLGAALAREMSAAGAELILSARSKSRLEALAAELPGKSQVAELDVANADQVKTTAAELGNLDGVVFLAGAYWPMPATAWDAEKALTIVDVNFIGCLRLMGAVVPDMVARGSGHIVITGSLSGFRGLPGAIGYAASKAGVMSLAESMYADLRNSDILVQLVNPGFIRTRLTDKNDFAMPFIMEPDKAAKRMMRHMESDRFSCSFPAPFSWLFRVGQFMPNWLYYRLFA